MKFIKVHKITIGEKEDQLTFYIKLTNRSMIEFESMTDSNISSMKGTEDLLKLLYCTSKAGAKSKGQTFDYTYQQFIDITDDYYIELITKFSEALKWQGGDRKK